MVAVFLTALAATGFAVLGAAAFFGAPDFLEDLAAAVGVAPDCAWLRYDRRFFVMRLILRAALLRCNKPLDAAISRCF